jgi:carotenoid cleavage dioxygenase
MKEHTHSFFLFMDKAAGTNWPAIAPVMGGGSPPYNSIGHLNAKTGQLEKYGAGPTSLLQEPIFIPRSDSSEEGDGFVVALVNNYATMSSELHILDTKNFQKPQAIVYLPVRLRPGLHGNWVDGQDLVLASP